MKKQKENSLASRGLKWENKTYNGHAIKINPSVLLLSLELSVAFDAVDPRGPGVDHSVLSLRFSSRYGLHVNETVYHRSNRTRVAFLG